MQLASRWRQTLPWSNTEKFWGGSSTKSRHPRILVQQIKNVGKRNIKVHQTVKGKGFSWHAPVDTETGRDGRRAQPPWSHGVCFDWRFDSSSSARRAINKNRQARLLCPEEGHEVTYLPYLSPTSRPFQQYDASQSPRGACTTIR
jgi:hypothetical protein